MVYRTFSAIEKMFVCYFLLLIFTISTAVWEREREGGGSIKMYVGFMSIDLNFSANSVTLNFGK